MKQATAADKMKAGLIIGLDNAQYMTNKAVAIKVAAHLGFNVRVTRGSSHDIILQFIKTRTLNFKHEKSANPKKTKGKQVSNKIQPRDFAISFFRRFKQTDNIALCELIIDLTGWDRPDNNGQRHAMLKRFAREASRYERPANRKTDKDFYNSSAWKTLRYIALKNTEGRCECCGATAQDGVKIHVDHIKPRSLFPELELDLENLQILCSDCNVGKSNLDDTDWRIRM